MPGHRANCPHLNPTWERTESIHACSAAPCARTILSKYVRFTGVPHAAAHNHHPNEYTCRLHHRADCPLEGPQRPATYPSLRSMLGTYETWSRSQTVSIPCYQSCPRSSSHRASHPHSAPAFLPTCSVPAAPRLQQHMYEPPAFRFPHTAVHITTAQHRRRPHGPKTHT